MKPDEERRIFGAVQVIEPEDERAADGEPKKKKPKRMVGYSALFSSLSEDLGGFREVIMPGAFDRALREGHDVRALVEHDPARILGRTKAGTLVLSIDAQGLRAEIEPPDTTVGRDATVSVERGDLSQMSFAFRTLTDDWRTVDGEVIRELHDLELFDVSVVAYPAYRETSVGVSARALERAKEVRGESKEEPAPDPIPSDPEPLPEPEVPLEVYRARQRMNEQ